MVGLMELLVPEHLHLLTECGLYNVDVDGDGTVEAVFQTRRAAKIL